MTKGILKKRMEVHLLKNEARLKEDSIFQASKYWLGVSKPKKEKEKKKNIDFLDVAMDMDNTIARIRIQTDEIATRLENVEVNIADALGIDRRAETFPGVGQALIDADPETIQRELRMRVEEEKPSLTKRLLRSKPIYMIRWAQTVIWGIFFVTPIAAIYVLLRPEEDLNDLLHKYAPFPTKHD